MTFTKTRNAFLSHQGIAFMGPLILTVFAQACAAHVQLPVAPTKNAQLEERQGFYDEYGPLVLRQPTAQASINQQPGIASGPLNFLLLNNGVRVEAAEDLLPLVDDASPAAQAAREAQGAESLMWGTLIGMSAIGGLGSALMFSSMAVDLAMFSDNYQTLMPVSVGLLAGGSVLMLASLALLPLEVNAGNRLARERDTAFLTYDMSLKKRLGLPKTDAASAHEKTVQPASSAVSDDEKPTQSDTVQSPPALQGPEQ